MSANLYWVMKDNWNYLIIADVAKKARCRSSHYARYSEWGEAIGHINGIVEDKASNDEENNE